MASFTTGIEEQSSNGGSTTYAITATHTAQAPRLVLGKLRFATGNKSVYETEVQVVHGLVDGDGAAVTERLSAKALLHVPLVATSTEIDNILVDFRDFVASDEFTDMVKKQLKLQ